MKEQIGDKMERRITLFLLTVLFTVLEWKVVDIFIVNVTFTQAFFIEISLFILLILYIFITRKVIGAYRE